MRVFPLHQMDGYKVDHRSQYPEGTTLVYSNMTPRSTRLGTKGIINFGMQYFLKEYLVKQWNEEFFQKPLDYVMGKYKRRINSYLGPDAITFDHIEALHKLGYLPLKIKGLDEGMFVPLRVPIFTIQNTHKDFFWMTNALETLMSASLWKLSTTATTAGLYYMAFADFADLTLDDYDFVRWQGHDFAMRGMSGVEDAAINGMAHLIFFTGTDTFAAIDALEEYYDTNSDTDLIGGSVAATEHSVVCMGLEENEKDTILRLATKIYPKGILSYVSDTWDFWNVVTNILPSLKDVLMARDGKFVVRPDSGDPVKIICGDPSGATSHEIKGAIECLWDTFGGTITKRGFKLLDPHIGLIYGDSITHERQVQILTGLAAKRFASANVVLGIGSYTYQYVTRDTHGFAMKATYGEINGVGRPIFKKPRTDDGAKNSAKGLLKITRDYTNAGYVVNLHEDVSRAEEQDTIHNLLKMRFRDGNLFNKTNLNTVKKNAFLAVRSL